MKFKRDGWENRQNLSIRKSYTDRGEMLLLNYSSKNCSNARFL